MTVPHAELDSRRYERESERFRCERSDEGMDMMVGGNGIAFLVFKLSLILNG